MQNDGRCPFLTAYNVRVLAMCGIYSTNAQYSTKVKLKNK